MQTLYQLNKILHLPSQQELENVLDTRSTNNLGQAIVNMQQEFNWTQVCGVIERTRFEGKRKQATSNTFHMDSSYGIILVAVVLSIS